MNSTTLDPRQRAANPAVGLVIAALIAFSGGTANAADEQPIELRSGKCLIAFSPTNGAILQIGETGTPEPIFRGGEQGLWQLKFRDGSTLNAAGFEAGTGTRRFEWQRNAGGDALSLRYHAPEAVVAITVKVCAAGFDFAGTVTPTERTVLDFVLPGRLRFVPQQVRQFVSPLHPHLGVGAAFNGGFFQRQPIGFLKYDQPYPPVFADFLHLDASGGSASLYRIQPRSWKPWAGQKDASAVFIPSRLAFGGDDQGGWCERRFSTFLPAGASWTTPKVRLALGRSAEDDLRAYCEANGITRTLKEKLSPDLFAKFHQAVLVKYDGNARDKLAALDKLPVPALIHFSDYLKGGFDKEYPDHLPPSPTFGTAEELRAFHDRAHALGHLIMPYTNPTWWCDHPRGPTFELAGEAPLQLNLDGKPAHEKYSVNDGWTTTLWHPAVRAANRATMRQFTEDYPVDILFQDQCGARGWKYDLNPASPTPLAYAEGMLSMVEEDCLTKPLSTEDGWDRVVNAEAQLCGFTFALGPGRRPDWAREMKTVYPPGTWELYPFAQRIAHDKTAMLHHDLGKFVTDRPALSWTLGLGFAMSYRIQARALNEAPRREWLNWVDRIQKSICARYVGEPVVAFEHRQGSEASGDDGIIRATYGPVRIVANLSPAPRIESGRELAGYGFHASAPGMVAGNLRRLAGAQSDSEGVSFVTEGDAKHAEVWVYAMPGSEAAAEVPDGMAGEVTLTLDGEPPLQARVLDGAIRFNVPKDAASQTAAGTKRLWLARIVLR